MFFKVKKKKSVFRKDGILLSKNKDRESPGGPEVKTLCFQPMQEAWV